MTNAGIEKGIDPHAYNVTVRKIVHEAETLFEARVKELPDVCEYGETMSEAYDLAIDTIETAAEMYAEAGRYFPPPNVPQDEFSGRVTLRLPKALHRTLARWADEEGASLNQHLVNILAHHAGVQTGLVGVKSHPVILFQLMPSSVVRKGISKVVSREFIDSEDSPMPLPAPRAA